MILNGNLLTLDGSSLMDPGQSTKTVERFKQKLDATQGGVALDLRSLNNIHSLCIAVVIGLQKECSHRGREFTVLVPDNEVLLLLKMLKLDRVLDLKKEEPTA